MGCWGRVALSNGLRKGTQMDGATTDSTDCRWAVRCFGQVLARANTGR
jgi:hypothetical protein